MSGIHRAPWRDVMPNGTLGPEYRPRSVQTGRAVCHDRAEADFIAKYGSLHAIPVSEEPEAMPVRYADRHFRHDQDAIERWCSKYSHRLSQQELDVYVSFWVEGRSYAQSASDLDISKESVRDAVKRIRRKAGLFSVGVQKSY